MPKRRAPHVTLLSQIQVNETAQEVKVLASKPDDDLSSIPRSHITKGERQLLKVVLWFFLRHVHMSWYSCTSYIYIHTSAIKI